jgi:hypothetical protein
VIKNLFKHEQVRYKGLALGPATTMRLCDIEALAKRVR